MDSVENWKAFTQREDVVMGQKDNEPIAEISKYTCLPEFAEFCTSFSFDGWEHMKTQKAHIAEKFKEFSDMNSAVTGQMGRITNLLTRKENQKVKEAEREVAKLQVAAAKAQAKAMASGRQQSSNSSDKSKEKKRECKVFAAVDKLAGVAKSKLKTFKKEKVPDQGFFDVQVATPFIAMVELREDVAKKTGLDKFLQKFLDSDYYKDSGRGALMLPSAAKPAVPSCPIQMSGTKAPHHIIYE